MFKSPVAIFGLVVTTIGWLVLLFGAGRDTGYGGVVVANIHTMFIAVAAIATGGFLIVAGAVEQALAGRLQGVSPNGKVEDGVKPKERASATLLVDPEQLRSDLDAARHRLNGNTDRSSR